MPTLSDVADLVNDYIDIRDQRRQKDKEVEELKEKEAYLKATIISSLKESGSGAVAGQRYTATIKKKSTWQPADWDLIQKYIETTGSWDLVQRRLSAPAVRERVEDGTVIPGIVEVEVEDLSFTKLKGA